jgi:hypothetical protein
VHSGSFVQHICHRVNGDLVKFDGMGKRAERAVRDLSVVPNKRVDLVICVDTHERKDKATQFAVEVKALKSVGLVVWRLRGEGFDCVTIRASNPCVMLRTCWMGVRMNFRRDW